MEICEPYEIILDDHINKCRFCFRTLVNDQKSLPITKSIEEKFYSVTQLKLIEAEVFSSVICELCHEDLNICYNFKKDLVQKQKLLYKSVINSDDQENVEYFICPEEIHEDEIVVKDEIESDQGFICCDICNFSTHTKTDLESHIIRTHIKKKPNLVCDLCGMNFTKNHLLNRHVKLKHTTKERSFTCTHQGCEKAFFTLSALKKHVESHSEKELVCEHCGKLFSCLNNLRSHLYYHDLPKFICEEENCGKKFFARKLLKAHLNVHRGKKDFVCNYCDKSYFFQAHLKRHVISMHMHIKIDCELCTSSFARKETYRTHVINHHQHIGKENLEKLLLKIRTMKVENFKARE